MLRYEDCLALAELDEDEVEAVARHEHLPEMLALALAQYLCECETGERCVKRMILDDIEQARAAGNPAEAARLKLVLRHFCETHPRAAAAA